MYVELEEARFLKVRTSRVYLMVQGRKILHIWIGRNVRIRESDLNRWLLNRLITPKTFS